MQLPIQKHREIILLILFAHEVSLDLADDPTSLIMSELKISRRNVRFALEETMKVELKTLELDEMIRGISQEYDFDRITLLEKIIIRLALYEIIYTGLDVAIAISEAIRLCKKFGNMESSKFVNAIIDQIYHGSILALSQEASIS
jgi:N utilization substance protein B